MRWFISIFARLAVFWLLLGVASVVGLATGLRRLFGKTVRGVAQQDQAARPIRQILLTGTFYNPGWFRSHILPLAACQTLEKIIVVCDAPLFPVDKVEYHCPPRWLVRCLGRAGARFWWILRLTRRRKPELLMGYHIMPNALLCLVAAKLFGKQAVYQMTGGPIQISGGGVGSENALLRLQKKPSRWREGLMFHAVRQFDWIIVRGETAVDFIREKKLGERCLIIPGSVDCERFSPGGETKYDLITVGRLVPVKRPDVFLEIVAELKKIRPQTRAAWVGDGPLLAESQERTRHLGIESNIEFCGKQADVVPFLRQGRLFLLTSDNEGLSIAMIEAMAVGLPVLAPDIGDLGEVLTDGETGLFIQPQSAAETARRIADLLNDAERLERMSRAARRRAVEGNDIAAVAAKWDAVFGDPAQQNRCGTESWCENPFSHPQSRESLPAAQQEAGKDSRGEEVRDRNLAPANDKNFVPADAK